MSFSVTKSNRHKVDEYFLSFLKIKNNGQRVYVDMDKINNFHIFNEKYGVFHSFTHYDARTERTFFNVYVSPLNSADGFSMLSLLVRVDDDTIDDILTSLSTTDPRVIKKDV